MPHGIGGYSKHQLKPASHRSKGLGMAKKPNAVSLKNQIRSIERLLRKVKARIFLIWVFELGVSSV